MHKLPLAFRKNFKRAFDLSTQESLNSLSRKSGCSPTQAHKIASGDFDNSVHGPGLFAIWRMASQMGVSLNDLAPMSESHRPGIQEMMRRYTRPSPSIKDYDDVLEFCDIYKKPIRGRTRLKSMGPKSLLAEKTGLSDASILQIAFDRWPEESRRRVYQRQKRAWDLRAVSEPNHFDERYFSSELRVNVELIWSGFRVSTDGEDVLLVYCEPL